MSQTPARGRRTVKRVRWIIGGLLFLSTVVNYLDRQTLSVLAPSLKITFGWSNANFALVIIAFRVAYSLGQSISGPLLDRLGTRRGLSLTVAWYSVAAMLTALATGLGTFCGFRFLLGAGESANWPGATKAVSEWFPRRESGWAVALFDSGSSIGAAGALWLVPTLFYFFGSWRPVFLIVGMLGLGWLALFRWCYHRPEDHPWITDDERALILADRAGAARQEIGDEMSPLTYGQLLRLRQTWGIVIGKTLTDPIWFFITDWFAVYLVARGFALQDSLLAFWIPFLAADVGNFLGGGVSSFLIRRGWSVGAARKLVIVFGGAGMSALAATIVMKDVMALAACFSVATCAYAAISTMILNLPADIYPTGSVASVSGMSGTGAGLGTILATYLTGIVADRYSFAPILLTASVVPLLAVIALLWCIRNTKATADGRIRPI